MIRKLIQPLSTMAGTDLHLLIDSWMNQKLIFKQPESVLPGFITSQLSKDLEELKDKKLEN